MDNASPSDPSAFSDISDPTSGDSGPPAWALIGPTSVTISSRHKYGSICQEAKPV